MKPPMAKVAGKASLTQNIGNRVASLRSGRNAQHDSAISKRPPECAPARSAIA